MPRPIAFTIRAGDTREGDHVSSIGAYWPRGSGNSIRDDTADCPHCPSFHHRHRKRDRCVRQCQICRSRRAGPKLRPWRVAVRAGRSVGTVRRATAVRPRTGRRQLVLTALWASIARPPSKIRDAGSPDENSRSLDLTYLRCAALARSQAIAYKHDVPPRGPDMTFTIEFFRIRERDNAHVMLDVKGGRALRNVPALSVTLSAQCRARSPFTASSRPSRSCRPRRATSSRRYTAGS